MFLLLGCWWGWGCTNLKTKGQTWRVGRPEQLLLPAHFQAFEWPQIWVQSWQLSVIIQTTPRAPAPGSVSQAGERHLPGSDKMPVFMPAAASRLCGPGEAQLASPPSLVGSPVLSRLSSLYWGPQAQPLPGIYHRGRALFKNTWSSFIEISKGSESMGFLFGRSTELGIHKKENSPVTHLPRG